MTEYRSVNEALPALGLDLVKIGADVPSRAGATKELTFQHVSLRNPLEREIIVHGRKANLAAQIAETVWVLAGRNDVEWLAHYLPRAPEFSDDGLVWRAGYGPRLRSWKGNERGIDGPYDQLAEVIDILQRDPEGRRAVMSIWDPAVDLASGKDIPCNNWLHFLARDGMLNLHVAIRSNDLVWGWSGINQFEWSVLLEVVAAYAGLTVGRVHYSISSLHMYDRHWDKAQQWKVRSFYETEPTPRFDPYSAADGRYVDGGIQLDQLLAHFFTLEEALRTGDQSPELFQAIGSYPEPMLQSWLMVLAWWWTGDPTCLVELEGTRLAEAARLAVQPPERAQASQGATVADAQGEAGPLGAPTGAELAAGPLARWLKDDTVKIDLVGDSIGGTTTDFIEDAIALHTEKDAAYGTSWKRRGEMLGILANVARKVDRLGGAETSDETSADTAMDLMIYLAKYRTWLNDERHPDLTTSSDTPDAANNLLRYTDVRCQSLTMASPADYERQLREDLDRLETLAMERRGNRHVLVDGMLTRAYMLARHLWSKANENPTCLGCGSLKSNHDPGGSRYYCRAAKTEEYRGADHD